MLYDVVGRTCLKKMGADENSGKSVTIPPILSPLCLNHQWSCVLTQRPIWPKIGLIGAVDVVKSGV